MHKVYAFLIVVIAWSNTALSQRADSLFIQDLDTLKHWVETIHPDAFARSPKELWEEAYDKALSSTAVEEYEKLLVISELLKTLKDSHTSLSLGIWARGLYGKYGWPETSFVIKNEKLFTKEGVQVVELCGIRDSVLISGARTLAMLEGDNYHAENQVAGSLVTPLAMSMGNTEPGILHAVTLDSGVEVELIMRTREKRKKGGDVVVWSIPEGKEDVAYLKINSFNKGKSRKYYRTVAKVFRALEKSGAEVLVLDLRGNLGGNINRMNYLLRHLADSAYVVSHALVQKQNAQLKSQYKRGFYAEIEVGEYDTLFTEVSTPFSNAFDGEIALLVDGKSASASVSFAAKFKELELGPIFGTAPMGSKYGTSANPVFRTLPNSGIEVSIASAQIAMDSTYKWSSFPITPTRWVELSEDDLTVDPTDQAVEDWLEFPEVSTENDFTQRESKILFSDLETVLGDSQSWSGEVRAKVFGLIEKTDKKLAEFDVKIKSIQTSDLSEDQIMYELISIQGAKKSAIKLRNASIKLALPSEHRIVFEELTSETRPAVLHFGIHNRADCNVCKK